MGQITVYTYPLEGFQFQKHFWETIMKVSLYSLTKSFKVPQRDVKKNCLD